MPSSAFGADFMREPDGVVVGGVRFDWSGVVPGTAATLRAWAISK